MTTYTYNSADTPVALLDIQCSFDMWCTDGVVTSTISVPDSGVVTAARVRVSLSHTWVSDLHLQINRGGSVQNDGYWWSPRPEDYSWFAGGVTVVLSVAEGGDGGGYTDTWFDDAAGVNIRGQAAPFTGTFQPEGLLMTTVSALADFVGQDASGAWTLLVADPAGGDTGTLLSWSLEIDVEDAPPDPPEPPTCLIGNYAVLTNSVHAAFSGLACGQTLTAGSLTKNNAVATLDNIDTDCRRT